MSIPSQSTIRACTNPPIPPSLSGERWSEQAKWAWCKKHPSLEIALVTQPGKRPRSPVSTGLQAPGPGNSIISIISHHFTVLFHFYGRNLHTSRKSSWKSHHPPHDASDFECVQITQDHYQTAPSEATLRTKCPGTCRVN